MRVLGYGRVSTDEQADSGAGLQAQRAAVEAACAVGGYELVEFVMDEGYSGKDLKRPGIASVLERLAAGDAEGLVVAKLDRLSRGVLDFATMVEQSRQEGWALICLDVGVDTSTASGEVVANVLAAFAQFERRLIGERTKAALAVKRSEGVTLGRPKSVPADVVERIRSWRAGGNTFRDIADLLNNGGVPTGHGGKWWASTVRAICVR